MKTIPVPDGFSVNLPDFSLVFNVSPFPTIKPVQVVTSLIEVYDVDDHLVWVKLSKDHFGLFNRKQLNFYRCPTCGQEWHHEGE